MFLGAGCVTLGMSCAGPGVGLDDPCKPLPTQQFCDCGEVILWCLTTRDLLTVSPRGKPQLFLQGLGSTAVEKITGFIGCSIFTVGWISCPSQSVWSCQGYRRRCNDCCLMQHYELNFYRRASVKNYLQKLLPCWGDIVLPTPLFVVSTAAVVEL